MRPFLLGVLLASFVASVALAVCPEAAAPVTRYSTWSGKATSASDEISIPAGTRILLDETIPFIVNKITVFGTLLPGHHLTLLTSAFPRNIYYYNLMLLLRF